MKKNNFGIGVNKNYLSVCLATALLGYSLGAVSAADTPRQGGTIILATLKEPKCLDPTVGGDVPQDIIAHMFTDSLISQNEDGSYHPWLVKSWDVTDSGKTYTLHLRDDVKFTDGTKFNAVAVKANFAHWLDPNTGSANIAPQLTDLVSVTATDEYTLTVKLKKANSFFLTTLANPSAGMQSPKAFSRGNTVNCESPVGTGPFIVDKWNRGNEVIFKRNPNYNSSPPQALHTGPAYADKVIWQTITDPATRLNALLSGEVGVLNGLPPEGYLSAKATPDIAIIADFQPGVPWQIDLNIKRAPFNDLRVRQAFRYSLDAPAALRSIFFGAYKPAGGALSPNTPYYNSAVEHAYPYDISKADQLLDRAGWTERDAAGYRSKNGVRLTVHFPVYATTQPADLALYEQLQATAKKAGFDLQIEKQDDAQVYNRQYSWDYDLYIDYWTVNTPGALKFIYHSDGLKSLDGGYHNNEAGINDPQLDHLLNEGPTESEPAKVKQIYDQAQQIVSDQALAAPLYVYPSLSAFNKDKVRGVHTDWTVHSVSLYDAWVPQ